MASLNKVMLIGNCTRDPEVRFTPNGTPTCQIGLAINRKFRDSKTNEVREDVTFVDIDFWSKTAELVTKYVKKGSPLYVEGRLKLDQWEDKQTGAKRSKLKVVGEQVQFLGGGKSAEGQSAPAAQRPAAPPPAAEAPPAHQQDLSMPDSEVPF